MIALLSYITFCLGLYGYCFFLIQIHIKWLSVWIGKKINSTLNKYIHPKDFKEIFNQINLRRHMFLSLPHIMLRERAILAVCDIYWYSLDLEIIFPILYLLSYFINNLRYQSVSKWIYTIPLECMTVYLYYCCHFSLSRNLPTVLGCLTQAFLALLRNFFSSPKIKGLVLDTGNDNCNDNVSKSPTTWPSLSKTALCYVFEKLPGYY